MSVYSRIARQEELAFNLSGRQTQRVYREMTSPVRIATPLEAKAMRLAELERMRIARLSKDVDQRIAQELAALERPERRMTFKEMAEKGISYKK